ncbi:helix-turn-helix transcriptional regulator (plasmid) [Paraclostridium bifermentans]|uniref:Helix-turn-helix transcriptional regulator n=1 Tax=Paraclostridium bifermentans TaxID=1490 RepID=A0ABY8R955_PARBF|nr:helix-turn-helix transcriptional regulator [Paraclostridium bifermentans]
MDKVKEKKEYTVNSRIKKLRDEYLNLTQQEFADAIGLQRNTISVNENGGRNFSKSSLNRIAEKFNVNLDWLETGEGEVFKKI